MPTNIKVEATTVRVIFSILETTEKALPRYLIPKAIIKEKIITGTPVPKAKSGGNSSASWEFKTRGISTPKNKTPLYGQKAKANIIPKRKDPK